MEGFVRIYGIAAIALIVLGTIYRARREPERRWAYVTVGIAMSLAVVVGLWIATGGQFK